MSPYTPRQVYTGNRWSRVVAAHPPQSTRRMGHPQILGMSRVGHPANTTAALAVVVVAVSHYLGQQPCPTQFQTTRIASLLQFGSYRRTAPDAVQDSNSEPHDAVFRLAAASRLEAAPGTASKRLAACCSDCTTSGAGKPSGFCAGLGSGSEADSAPGARPIPGRVHFSLAAKNSS